MLILVFVFLLTPLCFFAFFTRKNGSQFQSTHPKSDSEPSPKLKLNSEIQIESKDMTELKSVFATFDKNKDGRVTKNELTESLANIGISMSETEIDDMIKRVDSNGDGLIDFDEFTRLFDSVSTQVDESGEEKDGNLKEAFDVFDGNGDGLISFEELGLVLSSLGMKEGKRIEDCKAMIKMVDSDGDGMVNFDEFKVMMRSGTLLVA